MYVGWARSLNQTPAHLKIQPNDLHADLLSIHKPKEHTRYQTWFSNIKTNATDRRRRRGSVCGVVNQRHGVWIDPSMRISEDVEVGRWCNGTVRYINEKGNVNVEWGRVVLWRLWVPYNLYRSGSYIHVHSDATESLLFIGGLGLLLFPPHGAKPRLVRFKRRNMAKVSSVLYEYPGAAWMMTLCDSLSTGMALPYLQCIYHIAPYVFHNLLSKGLMYIWCPRNRPSTFPIYASIKLPSNLLLGIQILGTILPFDKYNASGPSLDLSRSRLTSFWRHFGRYKTVHRI